MPNQNTRVAGIHPRPLFSLTPRPQLFKSWISLSTGSITIHWINIRETNSTFHLSGYLTGLQVFKIRGLVYSFSHDCLFDIDRDVSTAHCRSSSGDSVDLLSRTICTNDKLNPLYTLSTMINTFHDRCLKCLKKRILQPRE